MDVEDKDVELVVNEMVQSLPDYVEENDRSVTNEFQPTFDMAPTTLRSINPSCFKPRVVSIGPIHHNDENLQRYEERKAAAVKHLLSGSESLLTACVRKVASMILRIRICYNANMLHYYDDSILTKMMVMDVFFILKCINDGPYFGLWKGSYIPYDLVLLENQIPFFVLEAIYEYIKDKLKSPDQLITEFILPLLNYINIFEGRINYIDGAPPVDILDYLHHCYRPVRDIVDDLKNHRLSILRNKRVYSAVELDMAGVNFKPQYLSMADMNVKKYSYLCRPTLTMAKLRIDDFTELVLRNLIAYEQLHGPGAYVTSYARALDMLINTHEDIATLVRSKVIDNGIGSNEEAANIVGSNSNMEG